ncbi:hypothetical protein SAY87_000823 [Trapa incisa]|uniref:Sigma factor n=1 Tax=Trapa incisa TaxID=236973 RepID=A0AAN7JGX5_9MYRT|nr:hypothetical protein SAY87_000823 [Trapa incisa]
MEFRLGLRWDFPLNHHRRQSLGNCTITRLSVSPPSSSPDSNGRGKETCFSSSKISFLLNTVEEGENMHKDPLRMYTCPSASLLTLGHDTMEMKKMKVSTPKRLYSRLNNSDGGSKLFSEENKYTSLKGLQVDPASHFSLLMENVDALEATISSMDLLKLEKDILQHLGRLGALKLFQTCMSKTVGDSTCETFHLSYLSTKPNEEIDGRGETARVVETVIRSGKRRIRKMNRGEPKMADRISKQSLPSFVGGQPINPSARQILNNKKRRLIAKSEAEMSKGIKVIADLERIRTILEEETGQVSSLALWAEAAGMDEKVLQQSLHFGWFCRDKILRSTRSLVLFLARNYTGLGIAHEDLIQAGNMGVILGAERFDHTRGCKFSTYVQYWIRKSMSRMVHQHSRGIKVPYTLSSAINQIQKARKSLRYHYGRHVDDEEISKFTGLSLAKIKSASKCLRVVGSIEQKVGDCISAKYMEVTPDHTIKDPKAAVMRQHMRSEILELLNGLDLRERQVIALRYGIKDQQPRSLEEIGKIFQVSKEWIRKIEKKALKKLRDPGTCQRLSHYMNL